MRSLAVQIAAFLVLSLALGLVTKAVHPRAPAWSIQSEPLQQGEITSAMVEESYAGDVLWIDARKSEDFFKQHIPGALSINPQDHENQLFDNFEVLQVETRPVVIYCGSHACQASKKIADYLRENTILEPIYVLRGGWPQWVKDGGAVE